MFGYIAAVPEDLTQDERVRYREVYCGLCRRLGELHGVLSRLSLTYDMSFLIILLESLYEPESEKSLARCIVHPARKYSYSKSSVTDYAADMSVALTYYKCMEDWSDDKKPLRRAYAGILKNKYDEVKSRYPDKCALIKDSIMELADIERRAAGERNKTSGIGKEAMSGGAADKEIAFAREGLADDAINCFGRLMAEMFIMRRDEWSGALRRFGECLGRFIYLMDAVMDFKKDTERGSFNPIAAAGKHPEDMTDALTFYISGAAQVFERLPLVNDMNILRSTIYNGVWQKYRAKEGMKEKRNEKNAGGGNA